uniref:Uncharacterized protein n=1 Tax=Arundo donax TaxID=35708 RepID=A0A0A9HB81_ARUDO
MFYNSTPTICYCSPNFIIIWLLILSLHCSMETDIGN